MCYAQTRVRKGGESVPRVAGEDVEQMRGALVLGRDLRQRSGISNAQRRGEAQQATTRDGVQGPASAALTQPSGVGVGVGIKIGIRLDLRQRVQHVRMRGEQVAQSWISFTARDASNLRRLSIGLRLLLYLRICAFFARHARRVATACAVGGASSNLRVGVAVHASFISRRGAAVKPRSKNFPMIADVIQ